jgi:hypothetical protein
VDGEDPALIADEDTPTMDEMVAVAHGDIDAGQPSTGDEPPVAVGQDCGLFARFFGGCAQAAEAPVEGEAAPAAAVERAAPVRSISELGPMP